MGKYKIKLTEKAVNDISQYLKHGDKASFSKVQVLLDELIYTINEEVITVVVVSASGHYQ